MNRTDELKNKLKNEQKHSFESLRELVEVLRSEGGCPWDREQTHASIRADIIEETYEVIEAIDNSDPVLLREELGDVMFQVFLSLLNFLQDAVEIRSYGSRSVFYDVFPSCAVRAEIQVRHRGQIDPSYCLLVQVHSQLSELPQGPGESS
ncbi:MAG: hypothetical protein J6I42_09330, partial [Clostridia bacterium]|nr:hypothetical protein [Clostridia bacterium]